MRALQDVLRFDPQSKDAFVRLQNRIVDPRYAERDWRSVQNFVGETLVGYRERVHYVCPRPENVPGLMRGFMRLTERLLDGQVDAVMAAAVIAFAFVFVHPFEDGNGRIHRYLVHHVLARLGFTPPGVVVPVSASILRDRLGYDRALETFSDSIMPRISWDFTPERDMVVSNDTLDLYRFFDATPLVEYLYGRVEDTIQNDFIAELEYLTRYDHMLEAIREVLDMPDRRASLFVRLCLQNGGRLSRNKRDQFPELSIS